MDWLSHEDVGWEDRILAQTLLGGCLKVGGQMGEYILYDWGSF